MMNREQDDILHRINPAEPRLIYRYSPARSIIVTCIFLVICTVVGFFMLNQKSFFTILIAIFSLFLLLNLLKSCSVKVWLDWPNLIYVFRSCFRNIDKVIPSWKISGISPEITSMWRGNISERLVLEVEETELVLTPYYSESDPATAMLMDEIRSLPSSRKQAEYEIKLERDALERTDASKQKDEEETVKETVWGMLEMSIECPRCDGPVVINGPFTRLTCPECREDIRMSHDIWADLLEDIRDELAYDLKPGHGKRSVIWGILNTSLYYGRLHPYCLRCKRDFDMVNEYDGGDYVTCPDCRTDTAVLPAPDWFDKVFEGATLIVGAQKKQSAEPQIGSEHDPFSFTCDQCGASLLTCGEERTVKCEHCGTSLLMPDELWLHFHPAPTKKRWFVGFEVHRNELTDGE